MEDVGAAAGDARTRSAVLAWLAVCAWCVAIFTASAMPARELPGGAPWHLDKLVHAAIYAAGAWLLFRALRTRPPGLSAARAAPLAVWLSAIYAVTDEWHQRFVPGRHASAGDLLADTAGAFIACALLLALSTRKD